MSQVLVTRHPERIGRLVLTNCDTYENFPPGIFKAMPPLAKLPGGMTVLSAPFRIGAVARGAFKPFAQSRIPDRPDRLLDGARLSDPAVRRDPTKVTAGMNKRYTLEAAEKLRDSDLPILLAWAPGTGSSRSSTRKGSPEKSPHARIVTIPDAKHLRPARPTAAPGRRDRPLRRLPKTGKIPFWVGFSPLCRFFVRRGAFLYNGPHRGRRAMPPEIFDQNRPRSTMAQQLDEAFAGCDS